MYTKKILLTNYGPIEHLEIVFPFREGNPQPVVLVGENGSGKSILLSHIVNGLVWAKNIVFPDTPEVDTGKVYKLRSGSYIRSGCEYSFGHVEFEDSHVVTELRTRKPKQEYDTTWPDRPGSELQEAWNKMKPEEHDYVDTNLSTANRNKIENAISNNCALYFPHNRFEEPAWLNEMHLKAQAQFLELQHIKGRSSRRVINHSPLHDNQNWLFEVLFDSVSFEMKTILLNFPTGNEESTSPLPVFSGYSGTATSIYETALQIVQAVTKRDSVRLSVGDRSNRAVYIASPTDLLALTVFQLSSGETSLLNIFLSILRDFDLCEASFSSAEDIRGIVVIDEIDLHLHSVLQYEVLPNLIQMFPKVQFIITTHSPLFVLGMQQAYGEDGFSLYQLPQGQHINSEEFSEFGEAYKSFSSTRRFSNDIRRAIREAQKPVLFTEGDTDRKYLKKASQLLEKENVFDDFEVRDGGGSGKLSNVWNGFKTPLTDLMPQKVLLLFDCDTKRKHCSRGKLFQRTVPNLRDNPIKVGIENLLSQATLERAHQHKPAYIDIEREHRSIKRGVETIIPEKWAINDDEKMNLCNWLCENGTQEDFQHFGVIFDLMEEVINADPSDLSVAESESIQ